MVEKVTYFLSFPDSVKMLRMLNADFILFIFINTQKPLG